MRRAMAGQEAILAGLARLPGELEDESPRSRPHPSLPAKTPQRERLPVLKPRDETSWEKERWETRNLTRRKESPHRRLSQWAWWTASLLIVGAACWVGRHSLPFPSSEFGDSAKATPPHLPGSSSMAVDTASPPPSPPTLPPSAEEARTLIQQYLGAQDLDTLLPTIREPHTVLPLVTASLKKRPLKPRTLLELDLLLQQDLAGFRYYLAQGTIEETFASENFLILQDGDRGWRIDWETQVAYNPLTWKELKATRPTEETTVKVTARPGSYYNHHFDNPRDYTCLELQEPHGEALLFAYIGRDTVNAFPLIDLLQTMEESPAIVRIRYPQDSPSDNQVQVTRVEQFGWLRLPHSEQ